MWAHSLEKEMASPSSVLAWRSPWTEEPGGLQSLESQSQTLLSVHVRVHARARTHTHTHTHTHTEDSNLSLGTDQSGDSKS